MQQRTGNSGGVDTIRTFSLGLVGAGCALWLVAALVAIWSVRLGFHIAVRTTGITDDPPPSGDAGNDAAFADEMASCHCRAHRGGQPPA